MTEKRGWKNPAKIIEKTTVGKCPYCKKPTKSLEHHIQKKHLGKKLVPKRL